MHNIDNQNGTLLSLMQQVEDQSIRKEDFIAPTSELAVKTENGNTSVILEASRGEPTRMLEANNVAFGQLSDTVDIDVRTARRLQSDYPQHFDGLVNDIFQNEPKNRMLRTFDTSFSSGPKTGELRAIVSEKFKTFDNENLLQAALPQLMESDANWQVVSGTVTDQRLYLRLKSANQVAEPAVGDTMANGILLSNSEVGKGSVNVSQLAWTLWCLNGCTTEKTSRHTHVTSARGSDIEMLLTNEAKDADNKALELKLRDVVANYASPETFHAHIELMRQAHDDVIENGLANPQAVTEALTGVLKLRKKDSPNLLAGLMATIQQPGYQGKPISRATLVNAVTAVAGLEDSGQPVTPADEVDDWYKAGRAVLDLSPSQWSTVKLAA